MILFHLASIISLEAQEKRDYNWFVGSSNTPTPGDSLWWTTRIDFNTEPASISIQPAAISVIYSSAMMSSIEGELLFYSDGCRVRNVEYEIMPKGDTLVPGRPYNSYCKGLAMAPREGMIILPDPANSEGYWLLNQAVDTLKNPIVHLHKIFYSAYLDMSLNNGNGDVVFKGVRSGPDSLFSGLTAYRHANNTDWWIIIGAEYKHKFYKLLLDANGLNWQDTIEFLGNFPEKKSSGGGQNIFSPDGKYYVQSAGADDGIYWMEFNRETGELFNLQFFDWPKNGLYGGLSFSPSGQYLYMNDALKIWQLDMWDADPGSTLTLVGEWDNFYEPEGWGIGFSKQRLGPDCKIYIAPTDFARYIHVIQYPDRKGLACEFHQRYIHTPTYLTNGLPNFPYYRVGTPYPVCDSTLQGPVSFDEQVMSEEKMLEVYPNPFGNTLTVNMGRLPERGTILTVYDMQASVIYQEEVTAVNEVLFTGNWPAGVYIIHWRNEMGRIQTQKVVKWE